MQSSGQLDQKTEALNKAIGQISDLNFIISQFSQQAILVRRLYLQKNLKTNSLSKLDEEIKELNKKLSEYEAALDHQRRQQSENFTMDSPISSKSDTFKAKFLEMMLEIKRLSNIIAGYYSAVPGSFYELFQQNWMLPTPPTKKEPSPAQERFARLLQELIPLLNEKEIELLQATHVISIPKASQSDIHVIPVPQASQSDIHVVSEKKRNPVNLRPDKEVLEEIRGRENQGFLQLPISQQPYLNAQNNLRKPQTLFSRLINWVKNFFGALRFVPGPTVAPTLPPSKKISSTAPNLVINVSKKPTFVYKENVQLTHALGHLADLGTMVKSLKSFLENYKDDLLVGELKTKSQNKFLIDVNTKRLFKSKLPLDESTFDDALIVLNNMREKLLIMQDEAEKNFDEGKFNKDLYDLLHDFHVMVSCFDTSKISLDYNNLQNLQNSPEGKLSAFQNAYLRIEFISDYVPPKIEVEEKEGKRPSEFYQPSNSENDEKVQSSSKILDL